MTVPVRLAHPVATRLQANGIDRTEVIGWYSAVKTGDRLRIWVDAQWDRNIRCLVDDGGGRTNTSQ